MIFYIVFCTYKPRFWSWSKLLTRFRQNKLDPDRSSTWHYFILEDLGDQGLEMCTLSFNCTRVWHAVISKLLTRFRQNKLDPDRSSTWHYFILEDLGDQGLEMCTLSFNCTRVWHAVICTVYPTSHSPAAGRRGPHSSHHRSVSDSDLLNRKVPVQMFCYQ